MSLLKKLKKEADTVSIKLNTFTPLDQAPNDEAWTLIRDAYCDPDLSYRFLATVLNGIFTGGKKTFILSARALTDYLGSDPNQNRKSLKAEEYKRFLAVICHAKTGLFCERAPSSRPQDKGNRHAGAYELIQPQLLSCLETTFSREELEETGVRFWAGYKRQPIPDKPESGCPHEYVTDADSVPVHESEANSLYGGRSQDDHSDNGSDDGNIGPLTVYAAFLNALDRICTTMSLVTDQTIKTAPPGEKEALFGRARFVVDALTDQGRKFVLEVKPFFQAIDRYPLHPEIASVMKTRYMDTYKYDPGLDPGAPLHFVVTNAQPVLSPSVRDILYAKSKPAGVPLVKDGRVAAILNKGNRKPAA